MIIKFELTIVEYQLAERYAQKHNLSIEEAFKNVLFENIEDQCALVFAREAYGEYIKSGKKTRSIDELWKKLDI